MLKVRDLRVGSGLVLQTTSLDLNQNEVVAIMGPSGCGKSTLLKAIAGFVGQIEGEVSFKGRTWQDARRSYLKASQRPCTLLFQGHAIWPHLSVDTQLKLVNPSCTGLPERLGLNKQALGRTLSGGERQRLALARVLLTETAILLLDEPFASLDNTTKQKVISLLNEHREKHKCAILIATHDESDARALSARVFRLSRC